MTFIALCLTFAVGLLNLGSTAAAESIFRIALSAGPPSKGNPHPGGAATANFFWPAVYDSLTRVDNDGTTQPWLALSWELVTDTEWHFNLRPGVTFSNGEPFNAAAVKATFDRLRTDEAVGYLWHRQMDFYPRVDVIDELTISVHTHIPNAFAPAYLSTLYFAAPGHVEEVGFEGLSDSPVGTGPFIAEQWNPDKVTMRANRQSWIPPKIDALEVLFVPDASARQQALETGQIDVATVISTDQISMLEAAGHRVKMRNPTRVLVMALQTEDPASPFADVRVRRALNHAVNRALIADVLLAGLVEPASQPATEMALGYVPGLEPFAYDPDKARQLLADAGYADGFTFAVETVAGFLPNDTAILQQIASDLSRAGITMNVRIITYPQLLRATLAGELGGEALMADFFNNTGDGLRPVIGTVNHACTGVKPWYCNRDIQPIIDEARVTLDLDKRRTLVQRVIRHYRDDATTLLLFPVVGLDGIHRRVTHWEPWNDILNFHLVDVEAN